MKEFIFSKFAGLQVSSFKKNELLPVIFQGFCLLFRYSHWRCFGIYGFWKIKIEMRASFWTCREHSIKITLKEFSFSAPAYNFLLMQEALIPFSKGFFSFFTTHLSLNILWKTLSSSHWLKFIRFCHVK